MGKTRGEIYLPQRHDSLSSQVLYSRPHVSQTELGDHESSGGVAGHSAAEPERRGRVAILQGNGTQDRCPRRSHAEDSPLGDPRAIYYGRDSLHHGDHQGRDSIDPRQYERPRTRGTNSTVEIAD